MFHTEKKIFYFSFILSLRFFAILNLFIFINIAAVLPAWGKNGDTKESVVKIYTVYNRYNFHEPWQMQGQRTSHGSGSIISGKRILTNAHVVSDQTFIQVRRAGKAKKYTAEVEIVGHESDLAILTVKDESFFDGIKPLEIGDLAEIRDKVAVYGFPEGGDKLSITEGVVSRVEHRNYAHSNAYLLTCQIDASINSGNSGGPVIKDGKIIGVAFQGMSGQNFENIGYMVPAPVVKHFFEDIKDGVHDGTPDIGISMQKMENPDIRTKFFMEEKETGGMINKIFPDSPAIGLLQSQDIILSIDGENLENDGTIEFREGERTFFTYVMQKKHINDSIKFNILRKKIRKIVEIKLTKPIDFERLVPNKQYDKAPTYYIVGGLVFESLTLNYLMEYGNVNNWYLNAPTDLLNYYINGEPDEDHKEIVVMIKVLANELNVGYHGIKNLIISSVNGKKISNINDLVSAVEVHDGKYYTFEDVRGIKIVLSKDRVDKNNNEILEKYGIASDRSKDLKKK